MVAINRDKVKAFLASDKKTYKGLEKENLPKMDIGDLLYCFQPINGKHLTDTQRDTLRSYERMWTLVDDAFNKKEDSPNA